MIIMILFLNIERNNIFSTAHRTNRTYCVKALDMRTSILSLQKVIYILERLIIRSESFLQKYGK